MLIPKHPSSDDPRFKRTVKFLTEFFPDLPVQRARLRARSLVYSQGWAQALFHAGKSDKKALEQLCAAITKANAAMAKLSAWSQDALETELHMASIAPPENPELPDPPVTVEEFEFVIGFLARAAARTEVMRKDWRPSHGKNVQAILLIDDAWIVWETITGKPAPLRALNADPKFRFRRYLAGVFNAVGVHCDLSNAYAAWSNFAFDPNSPLEIPNVRRNRFQPKQSEI